MRDVVVYKLAFTDAAHLQDAFGMLLDHGDVMSSMVEPDEVAARFTASAKVGYELLERIYATGGLRWCSRHPIKTAS